MRRVKRNKTIKRGLKFYGKRKRVVRSTVKTVYTGFRSKLTGRLNSARGFIARKIAGFVARNISGR